MSEHDHREITPGCYRCDLNLDELDPRFDVRPEAEQIRDRIAEQIEEMEPRHPSTCSEDYWLGFIDAQDRASDIARKESK